MLKSLPSLRPLYLSLGCLATSFAGGQVVFELDPYPVSNGPVIEQVDLTTGGEAVTRVGQEQIHRLGAADLSAALRRVPGVTISRYNVVGAFGGGDGGAVFIRGQGSGRPGAEIATLTDGVARFVGVWSHPLLDTLPTDFTRSIEVFKSPQPVRFGNMGFGAVNLLPMQAPEGGWSTRLRAEYGAWETISLLGDVGFAEGGFNLYAGISRRESEGHRTNADGEVDAFQARVAQAFGDGWEASFLVQAVDSGANDPQAEGVSIPIVERYEVENQFYLAKLTRQGETLSFEVRAFLEEGDLDWRQWHTPPPPPFPAQQLNTLTEYRNAGLHSRLKYVPSDALTLTAGLDWDRYGGEVTEDFAAGPDRIFSEETFRITAPHASAQWSLDAGEGRTLVLSGGGRYFVHDVFSGEIGLQAGARLNTGRLSLYANYAHSPNYPGVYVSVFGRRPPPWNVGEDWKDLDPETIDHLEGGVQIQLADTWVLNAAVFRDAVEDALRISPPPPAGFILNLGDYTLSGAELSLQGTLLDDLAFFGGLTYLDSDVEVPNAPEWTLTLALDWTPFSGWTFSGDLQVIDEQQVINPRFEETRGTVEAYSLVNLRVSRELELGNGTLELYLRADNVLDEEYAYRPGYPMPGTGLTAGARYQF